MSGFKKYRRKETIEFRAVTDNDIAMYKKYNLDYIRLDKNTTVSITETDRKNGSPKIGDVIMRGKLGDDTIYHLFTKEFFEDNYVEI
jgi:hypothetical protein